MMTESHNPYRHDMSKIVAPYCVIEAARTFVDERLREADLDPKSFPVSRSLALDAILRSLALRTVSLGGMFAEVWTFTYDDNAVDYDAKRSRFAWRFLAIAQSDQKIGPHRNK